MTWLEVTFMVGGWCEPLPVRCRNHTSSGPDWLLIGSNTGPIRIHTVNMRTRTGSRLPQPTKWTFTTQSLDAYEARLDQQIEVNNGHRMCVTAYEKDGTERWTACCLDSEELQENFDRGPA